MKLSNRREITSLETYQLADYIGAKVVITVYDSNVYGQGNLLVTQLGVLEYLTISPNQVAYSLKGFATNSFYKTSSAHGIIRQVLRN